MIRYLIKNNFKLMSRSITNILLFIIAPLILIALLSSAFNDMMKKYEKDGNVIVGYAVEGEVFSGEMLELFKQTAKEGKVTLVEYHAEDPKSVMKQEEICGFIVLRDDSYTVYQKDDQIETGKALEYMVGRFYERIFVYAKAAPYVDTPAKAELTVEHPEYMEAIDSTDYYGIIEVIYFGWCAIVCGAGLFTNEKKYRIRKKYQVSNLSDTKIYLSRFVPVTVFVCMATLVSTILSVVLFKVHWGNPLVSVLIVILSAAAASAFGLMVYSILDNMVAAIIATFAIVWFAGFFGGSFETYMFSAIPMSVKQMSPIYHINRSLVELSCMGKSDYVVSAIVYSISIIVVSSVVAVFADTLRRRGKA